MNTTTLFGKIWAILLLVSSVFALSANAGLIPVTNVSSLSNTFECYITAMQTNVTIGTNNNVQAMIYADTATNAPPLVTTNGIPIPLINLNAGEMFVCHFSNGLSASSMDDLVSIHWHGLELDNDSDGTAITQDALLPGENYTYRFMPLRPGLFWFHNHMNPASSTFAGMYGVMIIPNLSEPGLIASNVLPVADYTHTLVLSDIEFNLTNGFVGKFLQSNTTNWYSLNELADLCHKYTTGDPGGDNNACGVAGAAGKTVLVNGATPNTNLANLYPLYIVPSGQRVRLHLFNEATSRDFRLTLLYPDPSRIGDTNLYRIGGQDGLLNNIRLEGGVQGIWNTLYNRGEIVIGSGERSDVLIYPTGTNGDIIQLVGNNLPTPFNLSGPGGPITFPTNYPIAYFQISGTVSNYADPASGDPILANTAEYVPNLKTNTDLNTLAAVPVGLAGTTNPVISLTTTKVPPGYATNSPAINGFAAGALDANMGDGEFVMNIPTNPPTTRYAHVGDLLELSVSNQSSAVHPFHLHGFSMQPVRMVNNTNGATLYNFDYNEFVDTVDVYGGQTYVFRVRLEDRPKFCDETTSTPGPVLAPCTGDSTSGGLVGRWLYHCHIFLHAGLGMISEIDVLPKTSSVTITGVTSLPGGGIQFNFNVPEGTNYVVESSDNLINWRTNFTGIGLTVGEESYTNAVGTNMAQFYRIQY